METYGDLKKAIRNIQLKKKGEKVGKVALDAVLGSIPGLSVAKSTFDVVSAAFRKPDTKKSNSWLDKLDIDDEMEAIVDDTVENGFLKMQAKVFDSEPDDKKLESDFNMNAKMVNYLKNTYKQRTITGISEQKSVFDKFFTKFAYKFDKGYPDMNNDQDVLLLETLLDQLILLEFEDKGNIPDDIEQIRSSINTHPEYKDKVEAVQMDTNTNVFIYIKGVSGTVRAARTAVTKDLQDKGLLPKGEINDEGSPYLNTGDYKIYIKGAGKDKYATNTDQKEGLVVVFYNALKQGWNKKQDPFNKDNMSSLLSDLVSLGGNIYGGLGSKAKGQVEIYLERFDDESSSSKGAQVILNDNLSSALRIFEDYPEGEMMRGETFDRIKSQQAQKAGLKADKVNPGDIFLKVGDISIPPTNEVDVTGLEELNKVFVNKWGDKPGLVAISLKGEKAQAGKAKSYLNKFTPKNIEGQVPDEYNLSQKEIEYSDDQFDSAIDQLKKETLEKIGSSEFIDYKPGKTPSTTNRKKFKLAAYKSLDYLFRHLKNEGALTPAQGLVKMTAFGMSITDVNPTFFKLIGKSNGSMASVPERTPAGATAQLTPGTKITIEDKDSYGGLKINISVDILEGDEVYSQYDLELVMRSNGNKQNTIEIQKSTKK